MANNNIIFVRYCPGSAGNFIISLLMLSQRVSHWHLPLEENPSSADDHLKWFRGCFTHDIDNHLKHEPHHPYCLDFISAKHDRGDDLTTQQFLQCAIDRDDRPLLQALQGEKSVIFRLNKSRVPDWATQPKIVNIVIDPNSHRWLHRTRLLKLFGRDQDHWISKENSPEFLACKNLSTQFQNQYKFDESNFRFIRRKVIDDPIVQTFKHQSRILMDASNSRVSRQFFINLSDIFHRQRIHNTMVDLYGHLGLGQPDHDTMLSMIDHYFDTNVKPVLMMC